MQIQVGVHRLLGILGCGETINNTTGTIDSRAKGIGVVLVAADDGTTGSHRVVDRDLRIRFALSIRMGTAGRGLIVICCTHETLESRSSGQSAAEDFVQ